MPYKAYPFSEGVAKCPKATTEKTGLEPAPLVSVTV